LLQLDPQNLKISRHCLANPIVYTFFDALNSILSSRFSYLYHLIHSNSNIGLKYHLSHKKNN